MASLRNDNMGDSDISMELGMAVADRLGLIPDETEREWTASQGVGSTVVLKFTTVARMPEKDFNELFAVARERAERKATDRHARRALR